MVLMSKMLKSFGFVLFLWCFCIFGARAQDASYEPVLPDGDQDITSGIYYDTVSQDSTSKTHTGNISVSGEGDLNIFTEQAADSYDASYTLNGQLTVGSGEAVESQVNGIVSIINMSTGKFDFTMNDGAVLVQNGGNLYFGNNKGGTMNVLGVPSFYVQGDKSVLAFSGVAVGGDNKLESISVGNMGTVNLANGTAINGSDGLKAVNVLTGGKLSLKDSSLQGDSFNLTVQDYGTVELDNSTLSINNAAASAGDAENPGAAIVFDNAALTLKNSSKLEMKSSDNTVASGAFSFTDSDVDVSGSSTLSKGNSGDMLFSGGSLNLGTSGDTGDISKISHSGSTGSIRLSNVGNATLSGKSSIERTGTGGDIVVNSTGLVMKDEASLNVSTASGKVVFSSAVAQLSDKASIQATGDSNEVVIENNSNVTMADESSMSADHVYVSNGGSLELTGSAKITAPGDASVSDSEGVKVVASSVIMSENASIEGDVSLENGGFLGMSGNAKIDGDLNTKSTTGYSTISIGSTSGGSSDVTINGSIDISQSVLSILNGNTLRLGAGSNNSFKNGSYLSLGTGKLDLNGGNLTMSGDSTLTLRIASESEYGQILNAGKIDIKPGAGLDVSIDKNVVSKGQTKAFQILSGTVDGDWVNLNRRYKFDHLGGGKYNVTQVADAGDIVIMDGGTENNANTANAWLEGNSFANGSEAAKVYDELDYLSQYGQGSEYVDALTALAPDAAPLVRSLTTENSNQIFNTVQNRLEGGSSLRMKPGRAGRYARGLASGDMYREDAIWVQGLYNHSELSDTKEAKGFEIDSYGGAIGLDNYVTDSLKLGIGYAYTHGDISGFLRDTDVDTHTGFVYGEFKPNRWFLNAIASYSFASYDEEKRVSTFKVKGDYDVNAFGAQVMTGYKMGYVTPELGVRYLNVKQDAYEDSIGQRVDAVSNDVLTGVFGIRIKQDFFPNRGFSIRPEVHVAATYDFVQDDAVSVVSLPNGSVYQIEGENLDKFGLEAGAGLTLDVGNRLEMAVSYEGKFRKDYTDHSGLVNMKFKF
ncbi:MAG: autotransporter domain-containing protein [Alphaproteobacteria bacterium]